MTNIATKSGSVVIKNGSIGSDCGCCGGPGACREGSGSGASCTLTTAGNCTGTGKTFYGAGSECGPDLGLCCPENKPWRLVLYVRCTDSPFSPCYIATLPGCGCDKIPTSSELDAVSSTYATWTINGRKGKACAITQRCGKFSTEQQCIDAGANVVGYSSGLPSYCFSGQYSGTVPWGNGPVYDPSVPGYKWEYDCIQCTPNPLP